MAGRFVFQKFSSGVSRSTSLLGPRHVSASSAARAAGAPVTLTAPDCGTRNISNALHGHGAALRPGFTFPNNHGIYAFAINHATPTFVDSVTGSKRGLSSTASNKDKPSEKAKPQKGKVKYERVHNSTPSFVMNSLATVVMGFGLIIAAKDN